MQTFRAHELLNVNLSTHHSRTSWLSGSLDNTNFKNSQNKKNLDSYEF